MTNSAYDVPLNKISQLPQVPQETQAQQQQDPYSNNPINYDLGTDIIPSRTQENNDILRYGMDLQDIHQELENNLRGLTLDIKTGSMKQRPGVQPLMNEEGITRMMAVVRTYITRIGTQSFLEKEQISNIMIEINEELLLMMAAHYDDFEIDDNYIPYIISLIENPIFLTLQRALQGGDRNLLRNTTTHIQKYSESMPNKGGGIFNALSRIKH